MDDLTGHPDDATLFDLLEGALDPAREQAVVAHLERCAACAAFVDASRAGAPETTTAVVAMPEQASERLHLRLAEGWRERTRTIAAAEAREDAAAPATPVVPVPVPVPVPLPLADDDLLAPQPLVPSPRPAQPTREGGWRRLLVPGLAFAVLATLAGTSIWVGDDASRPEAGSAGQPARTAEDPQALSGTPAEPSTAAPAQDSIVGGESDAVVIDPSTGQPGAAVPATAGADSAGGAEAAAAPSAGNHVDGRTVPIAPDAATDGEFDGGPPVGYEQLVPGEICIIALDETQLFLPDGRIPRSIHGPGPYGIYLVCG